MLEKIEFFLKDLLSCLQVARLYTTKHPRFNKFIDKAYDSLQDVLKERGDLIIGIIGEEMAFENEILFDLSKMARPVIIYLKDRDIEKMSFHRGVQKEELTKIIEFLVAPKEEIKRNVGEYLALAGVKNISLGKIKAPSLALKGVPEESTDYLTIYEDSSLKAAQSLETVLNLETIDYLSLRFTLMNVMENLISRYREILKLTAIKRYDISTFMHSLNVCILSMYFSSKLGFAKDDCLDIGVAALFHDIGKLYISRQIIKKPGKLTEEEFTEIRSHVILGTEILLKYADSLGVLPVVVCFEHHLRYDLGGYPKVSFARVPHTASLIVSICDVYDALNQRRNYKNDYPPDMIYNLMIIERGALFDSKLIDAFFKIMGVWPIGSIVSLNNNRIAVVREENEDDIFSPRIEVIVPMENREFINLKDTKEAIKIEKFVNPWKEGKDYLALI
jgi:putative nucleotidyltransferase with HDIG domain